MDAEAGVQSDQTLLRRFAEDRDETALEELVRRHGPMVSRVCARIVKDTEEARDAAQATFLALSMRPASAPAHALGAWLHGVARRVALDARRSLQRRAAREKEAAMQRGEQPVSRGPLEAAVAAEMCARLDAEIAALPRAQRQAVVLRYLEGRSQEESAQIAGCPQGTLGRRASDGLGRLRRRLSRRGAVVGAAALVLLLEREASAAAEGSALPGIIHAVRAMSSATGSGPAASGVATTSAMRLARRALGRRLIVKITSATSAAAVVACVAILGISTARGARGPADAPRAGQAALVGARSAAGVDPVATLTQALDRRVSFNFGRCPLDQAIEMLGGLAGLPIEIAEGARDRAATSFVNAGADDLAVRDILDDLCERARLRWHVRGGLIAIELDGPASAPSAPSAAGPAADPPETRPVSGDLRVIAEDTYEQLFEKFLEDYVKSPDDISPDGRIPDVFARFERWCAARGVAGPVEGQPRGTVSTRTVVDESELSPAAREQLLRAREETRSLLERFQEEHREYLATNPSRSDYEAWVAEKMDKMGFSSQIDEAGNESFVKSQTVSTETKTEPTTVAEIRICIGGQSVSHGVRDLDFQILGKRPLVLVRQMRAPAGEPWYLIRSPEDARVLCEEGADGHWHLRKAPPGLPGGTTHVIGGERGVSLTIFDSP
jgi:RNA polymerase sigma factor (sigma-70 family)